MADRIITVTDPSVVTNDTLAGYNNYSNIDGQLGTTMTPTEATNGHTVTLSDGATHQVTSKPVGTSNGEFSAVVSNAVTVDTSASTILFEDDFAGTTIDTNKWTVTNPNSGSGMTISQNNELIFTAASPTTSVGANKVETVNPYAVKVFSFDWQATDQDYTGGLYSLGIRNALTGAVDQIGFERPATGTDLVNFFIYNNSAKDHDDEFTLDVATAPVTFKFVIGVSDIKCYSWNGYSWVEQSSWTGTLGSTDFHSVIHFASNGVADTDIIDNVYVSSEDFSTQYPT